MANQPKANGRRGGQEDTGTPPRKRAETEPADDEPTLVDGEDTILGELTDSFRWRFDPDLKDRSSDAGDYLGELDFDDGIGDLADRADATPDKARDDSQES